MNKRDLAEEMVEKCIMNLPIDLDTDKSLLEVAKDALISSLEDQELINEIKKI